MYMNSSGLEGRSARKAQEEPWVNLLDALSIQSVEQNV
jgi:hypothetical protein